MPLAEKYSHTTEEIYALPERPFFHFKTNRIGMVKAICEGTLGKE